jgi:uncharacterized protein
MSEPLDRVIATASRLKVFPLPSVVMLPGGSVPLHIFEPRYRAMVRDALAQDSVFALAQIQPGQERFLAASPMLEPIVCAGTITMHEELEEGRFNLVLTGVVRARIIDEVSRQHLYRELVTQVLPDDEGTCEGEPELRAALLELMARLPMDIGQRLAQVTSNLHGGLLADAVAAAVVGDTLRRYELLETLDPRRRLVDVCDEVLDVAGRIRPKRPDGLMN